MGSLSLEIVILHRELNLKGIKGIDDLETDNFDLVTTLDTGCFGYLILIFPTLPILPLANEVVASGVLMKIF